MALRDKRIKSRGDPNPSNLSSDGSMARSILRSQTDYGKIVRHPRQNNIDSMDNTIQPFRPENLVANEFHEGDTGVWAMAARSQDLELRRLCN